MQGIYRILNTKSPQGYCYVGSSQNIPNRWAWHVKLLSEKKHHSYKLQKAWNTYGSTAFTFSILEIVLNREKLLAREQHYIDTLPSQYNVARIAGEPPSKRLVMTTGVKLPNMLSRKKIKEISENISVNDKRIQEQMTKFAREMNKKK